MWTNSDGGSLNDARNCELETRLDLLYSVQSSVEVEEVRRNVASELNLTPSDWVWKSESGGLDGSQTDIQTDWTILCESPRVVERLLYLFLSRIASNMGVLCTFIEIHLKERVARAEFSKLVLQIILERFRLMKFHEVNRNASTRAVDLVRKVS